MNKRFLITAFLVFLGAFTNLASAQIAETLGEHPAVTVARTWSTRGIDPNTFIVLHPAGPQFPAVSPTEKDKATGDAAPVGTETGTASPARRT